jgi:hypothetical protein
VNTPRKTAGSGSRISSLDYLLQNGFFDRFPPAMVQKITQFVNRPQAQATPRSPQPPSVFNQSTAVGGGPTFHGQPVPQPELNRQHVFGPGTEGGYPLIPDPNPINNPAAVPVGTSLADTFEYGQPGRDALPSDDAPPVWSQVDPAVAGHLVNPWMWIGSPEFNAMTDEQKANYLGPDWKTVVANAGSGQAAGPPRFMGQK